MDRASGQAAVAEPSRENILMRGVDKGSSGQGCGAAASSEGRSLGGETDRSVAQGASRGPASVDQRQGGSRSSGTGEAASAAPGPSTSLTSPTPLGAPETSPLAASVPLGARPIQSRQHQSTETAPPPQAPSRSPRPRSRATFDDFAAESSPSTRTRSPSRFGSRPSSPGPSQSGKSFARSLSQLSLSNLKSLSRPGTPTRSSRLRNDSVSSMEEVVKPDKGKGKAKLRQLLRLDSNKILPRSPRPLTPVEGYSASDPTVERVPSRGRSNSAPVLSRYFGSDIPPSSSSTDSSSGLARCFVPPAEWNDALAPPSRYATPSSTPFQSAVSSPLFASFAFSSAPTPPPIDPIPSDLFERYLPIELQLRVFQAVLDVCEDDWRKEIQGGKWTGAAANARWSEGRARGRRELARISQVSKTWRRLALDGQLWASAPSASTVGADALSPAAMTSIFDHSGAFVRHLDLRGLGRTLDSALLGRIVEGASAFSTAGATGLTSIDLTGCTSITSAALDDLLTRSQHLERVNVFALTAVDDSHMDTLGRCCPRLSSLNVSRCKNLNAGALLNCLSPIEGESSTTRNGLAVLKAAALRDMSDAVVVDIFLRNPHLAVLDLSFSRGVTDMAFERLVQGPPLSPAPAVTASARRHQSRPSQMAEALITTARVAPSPPPLPKRVVPYLRSLNVSGCSALSSRTFCHLAGSLPNLEALELSRLPAAMNDSDHLAALLDSCLNLGKIDLEDGFELTDVVLDALVPSEGSPSSPLEHLILNSCQSFTAAGIDRIVRSCSKLRYLEADGTDISDRTARDFVQLAKDRSAVARASATASDPTNPLASTERPAVLSILDNRLTGRRLNREVGQSIRPRTGHRGWWTHSVGFYHDDLVDEGNSSLKGKLAECDPDRVVVRSFYSSLAVDAANATREAKAGRESSGGFSVLRGRAMSDSVLQRGSGQGVFDDEVASVTCIVM
ncbi:hypothetical protein JCM10212_004370 [Sporobolomyces blumeae]